MDDYKLLSTTRWDKSLEDLRWNDDNEGPSPFLLLPYHHRRLIDAAQQHCWGKTQEMLSYDAFKSACQKAVADHQALVQTLGLRLRITLDRSAVIHIVCAPIPHLTEDPSHLVHWRPTDPIRNAQLDVRIDSGHIVPSLFTRTKTTQRSHYDDARTRNAVLPLTAPQGTHIDVLLVDEHNYILECTIFNIAFYRESCWITPHAKYGGLPGVFRQWLLDQGFIYEDKDDVLFRDSVLDGEFVLLFNGVQGCRIGKINIRDKRHEMD